MPIPHRFVALLAASLALWLPRAAYPWAQTGHRVIAEIAERHLEPEVRAEISKLLDGRGLAEISTWADDIRSTPAWKCAEPFHYVTVAPGATYPDQGVPEGDAIEALVFYADVIADRSAATSDRRTALRFLVHLVGDLHQPLHSGRGCDRGGNAIRVVWFDEEVNFHSVWDRRLIESERLSFTELADFSDHAAAEDLAAYQASTPLDWVREAQQLLDGVYTCHASDRCPCFCGGCDDGTSSFGGCQNRDCTLLVAGPVRLRYAYRDWALPVIRTQMVKGGARLAGMLSWIFSSSAKPPKAYRKLRKQMRDLPHWDAAAEAIAACDGSPRDQDEPR